jgi:hypothetical protein
MDFKTLFGLTVIPAAALAGLIVACLGRWIRDVFFVLLVFTAPMIEFLDINYVSRDWYRGVERGFEIAIADILALSLLGSSVLFPPKGRRRLYWPPALGIMLLYFLYACFNVAIAEPKLFALFGLFRMFRGLMLVLAVAFYLRSEREVRLLVLGVCMLVAFECLLALKQRYLDGEHRVYGTLDESNSLSVLLCTTAPVLVAGLNARLPKLLRVFCALTLPLACVGEVLTISRAGVVIIGIVLLATALSTATLRLTPRTIGVGLLVLLGATGILAKSWKTLASRYEESTLKQEYENKKNLGRGYYIRVAVAIAGDRFFGVGLNNWSYWVSNEYGPKLGYRFVPYWGTDQPPPEVLPPGSNVDMPQAAPAHSLGALTLGELGIPGVLIFTVVWLRWFQMGSSFLRPRDPAPLRRIAIGIFFGLLGTFLQNLTEWAYWHIPIYYTFHILLGALMSLYYIKRTEKRAAVAATKTRPEPAVLMPQAAPGYS